NISVDFTPVNDSPRIADILENLWLEDDNPAHEVVVVPDVVSPPALVDSSTGTWWDPDGDRVRDNTDIEVRFLDGATTKTSYCRGGDETLLRVAADVPGTIVGARCRVKAGTLSYMAQPNMGNIATQAPLYNLPAVATADLNIEWQCNPTTGCVAKFLYPLNAHGNNVFEYRVRSTRLQGASKEYRPDDWSDWKQVDVTVNPVPDTPLSTSVSLATIASDQEAIKEDVPFVVRLVRANGNGATNKDAADLGPTGAPFGSDQRLYHSYFDVDETDDIAVKVVVTSVSQISGVPVVRKADGSAIAANDDTLFTCDAYGVCEGTLLSAPDLNTRTGGDPFFSYKVITAPKATPNDVAKRLTSLESQISFKIISTDDSPSAGGPGGAGGAEIALAEDENNEVVIRYNGGAGAQLAYTDPDPGDYAEKIEIAEVTVVDPNPVDTLTGGYGWFSPPPNQVVRTGTGQYGWVLGEWRFSPTDKNTSYVTIPDVQTNSSSDRWRPADGTNPERFQFTCRSKLDGTLNQGDCRLIVRGPKDFNTRPFSTRAMNFKWRVFTRWQGDATSWDPSDETNGGWTPWSTATLAFGPVNDPPVLLPLNNALMLGSEPTTGTNAANNRVIVNEDEWSNVVFKYREVYDSIESTTETYTYKNDLTTNLCTGNVAEDPFFCMIFKMDWLATKFSVDMQRMVTAFWDNPRFPAPMPSPAPTPNPIEVIINPQNKTQLSSWMGGAWTEGTNGQFWGPRAPSASANATTNVNCKPDGECVLRMKPPPDFFGNTEFTFNIADGKTAPGDTDWSTTPRTLNVQIKNVDDLPGALPIVIDLFEDAPAGIEFGRIAPNKNACSDGYSPSSPFAAPCVAGVFGMAQDDPNMAYPWLYGRDISGTRYGACQQKLFDTCLGQTYYARLHSMFDVDRELPSDLEVRNTSNIVLTEIDGGFNNEARSLTFAPDFYNAISPNTTGRPFTYAGNADLGNASFEYRVKTKADEQCSDPATCWSNWSSVHTRVHPVNDGLRLNPGAASIPCTIGSTSTNVSCIQEITVQEDTKFSITVPNTVYYDPDSAQMPGRDPKYGRAIGITQCYDRYDDGGTIKALPASSDNNAFIWSPYLTFQTEYEDNFAAPRTDSYADTNSQLRAVRRSKGTLEKDAFGVPIRGHGQNASVGGKAPFPRNTSDVSTITELPGVTLQSSCALDGSNWPTGNCSMELMPSPHVTGTFTLCVQLTDPIGPGEFFTNLVSNDKHNVGHLSERIYIKVNVQNTPDVPRMSQMPARGRANEDHAAFFEIGPWNPIVIPSFGAKTGGSDEGSGGGAFGMLDFEDGLAVVKPGYFDFDGSKAAFLYVDMSASGGTFTGIKNAGIRYNTNPADTTYTQVCQAGFPASNVCTIPCDAQGWCRFKIIPGTDKGAERLTMNYWVRTTETDSGGISLSTKKAENLSAVNGNNPAFVPFEADAQYLNSTFNCIDQGMYIWDDWRTNYEEDHPTLGIPGLYFNAMNPILTPSYAQLSPPPAGRTTPNVTSIGKTSIRKLGLMPPAGSIHWRDVLPVPPGASTTVEIDEEAKPSGVSGVLCGNMTTARLVADFMEVPDKPTTQNVPRALLEDVPAQELYVGSSTTDLQGNGYNDGDGDGPTRLVFHTNLPASVGTLSLSATPPATPEGMGTGLLTDGNGRKYVPLSADLVSPGCQTANRRCLVYFHPAPNFSGTHSVSFSVVTGADDWASDPTALGSLQLNVAGANDAPVVTWTDTVPVSLPGGIAPTASSYRFNVFEGGGTDEETQVVSLSATSADPAVVTAQIRNESDTGAWSDAGQAASTAARLKLTPQPFASGDVLITVTATDSAGETTTWTKTVSIDNPNQKPGIVFDTFGAGPYEIDEDTGLVQELRIPSGPRAGQFADVLIDEGSGDANEQEVSVSFASNNILVLPNANISFSRTDSAGANNMGAATGRILLRPVGDMVTTATPVTVTMTVTETNVVPPKSENFVFTVHVKPANDAPTVSANLAAGSPYAGTEDVDLSIPATLDEGGSDDENAQTLGVSFNGYDTSLVQGVTFSRTDDGATNMGAAAGNIVVVPQPNAHGTTTITLNMDDGAGGTASQAFTVNFSAVNDNPRLVSGIAATETTNEDTPLVLGAVVIDEGGAASGLYNEDADVLTFSFTSSNTALVPVSNIVLNVDTDDATNASAVTRSLTITPVANQHGSATLTVRASDGVNSNVTLATVALTVTPVADLPAGNVACSPTNSAGLAAGSYLHKAGSSLAGKGITCSGISDADGDTVSYSVSGTCATGGMTIGATTGVVAGTMPATACSLVVSATAGGDEIAGGQKQTLSFAPGEVATATLTLPTLGANTTCAVSATPAATYSGGAVFASALASATTAGMGSFSANATTWSGVLEDFQPSGYTLRWAVTSNSGDTMNADLNVTLGKTALPVQAAAPAATL
ncbi:MAG: hypothetical protein IOD12_01255, partial [Silvanigrellales bacterium]|nr:hypothetical protein [Silvanigrellales bacterium]